MVFPEPPGELSLSVSRSHGRPDSRFALAVALLAVFALPFALGGVHPEIGVAATAMTFVALGVLLWRRLARGVGLTLDLTALPLFVALASALLSLSPLPKSLLQLLTPTLLADKLFMTAALPKTVRDAVLPVLAADPPEAAFGVVRLLGACALFLVVAGAAQSRTSRKQVFWGVLAFGVTLFVVAAGHALLGIDGAWGVFTHKGSTFYAPMVNPNHLARLFGATSLLCGMRAISSKTFRERSSFATTAVLCGVGMILCASRGALLGYAVACGMALYLLWRAQNAEHSALQVALTSLVLFVVAGAAAFESTFASLINETRAETFETSKAALYAPALQLLRDNVWGTGIGGFLSVFTAYVNGPLAERHVTFTHVENIFLSVLTDHGLVFGSAVLLAAIVAAVHLWRHLRDRSEIVAVPALAFLVISDAFDFVLDTTAGLFFATFLAALCAGRLERRTVRRLSRTTSIVVFVAGSLVLVAASVLAISDGRMRTDRRLSQSATPREADNAAALAAHPHDGHYAYRLAVDARLRKDAPTALYWANRALVVWPRHDGAHLEAARALFAMNKTDQALLEYRAAFESGGDALALLAEVKQRSADYALRKKAVPRRALEMLCRDLLNTQNSADAEQCLADVLADDSKNAWAMDEWVKLATRRGAVDAAIARLRPVVAAPRVDSSAAMSWLGLVETKLGAATAMREAEKLEGRTDARAIQRYRLDLSVRTKDFAAAAKALEALRQDGENPDVLAPLEADMLTARGDDAAAVRVWRRHGATHNDDARTLLPWALAEAHVSDFAAARRLLDEAATHGARVDQVQAVRAEVEALFSRSANASRNRATP